MKIYILLIIISCSSNLNKNRKEDIEWKKEKYSTVDEIDINNPNFEYKIHLESIDRLAKDI